LAVRRAQEMSAPSTSLENVSRIWSSTALWWSRGRRFRKIDQRTSNSSAEITSYEFQVLWCISMGGRRPLVTSMWVTVLLEQQSKAVAQSIWKTATSDDDSPSHNTSRNQTPTWSYRKDLHCRRSRKGKATAYEMKKRNNPPRHFPRVYTRVSSLFLISS
jgi:hypothetical protein